LLAHPADPQTYELTLLTASPEWERAARHTAGRVGTPAEVRLVPDSGSAAGWTGTAGIGAAGAVLIRPDRYIAWRSTTPPGAEELERALRAVFDT